jgi:hypothetical protein
MVAFATVPLPDSRISPKLVAKFSITPDVFAWSFTDSSGVYTGLVIHGLSDPSHGQYRQTIVLMDRTMWQLASEKKIAIEQIVRAEADVQGILGAKSASKVRG